MSKLPKQKSLKQLQKEVDDFNSTYAVGCKVDLKLDSGETIAATIKDKATILGGHSAVGWFEEVSGCYSLSCVNQNKQHV